MYVINSFHIYFQNEYLGLVEQCMDFACGMMDLCRGTQEVEAVLSEGSEENGDADRDPLARLKMAIEYEEKKVSQFLQSRRWEKVNCCQFSKVNGDKRKRLV